MQQYEGKYSYPSMSTTNYYSGHLKSLFMRRFGATFSVICKSGNLALEIRLLDMKQVAIAWGKHDKSNI
jgi:hypothetical protein